MFLIVDDHIEQRVYRLSPMGPNQPVLIGSGADVAVPIGSESVAENHCGLFVSGGHWFVRDLGSASGTFVNGVQARFSTPIIPGDKITLGEQRDAPRMTLSETKPPPRPVREENDDIMPFPEDSDELSQPFNAGIQQAPRPNYATPVARHGMSPEAMLAGALVMLVVLGIGAFFIYRLQQAKQTAIVIANTPSPPAATAPIKVIVKPATKPTQPIAKAPAASQPADPRASDEDWKRVDEAHRMAAPGVAILAYDDYLSRHPNTEWKKDLDAFTDDALDRIWWQRLKEVIAEQAETRKQIQPLQDHLKELSTSAPDPNRKKELTEQIADLTKKRTDLENEQFVKMKYTRAEAPDVYDTTLLATLRKERDATLYDAWKKEVLSSIRRNRGSLPW